MINDSPGILFYPGKNNGYLNHKPFVPEAVDGRAMVNPFYPNLLPPRDGKGGPLRWLAPPLLPGTKAICDSQAFQTWQTRPDMLVRVQSERVEDAAADRWRFTPPVAAKTKRGRACKPRAHKRAKRERMTPGEAIDAQIAFRARLRAELGDYDFDFEAVVTYDKLVDEAVVNGKQVKRRAAEVDAVAMVAETIASARVYQARRDEFGGAIAYAAQGATLGQYMDCVRQLLPLMRPGKDWLALGGFCIIGQRRSLIPLFIEVCREVAPLLARHGITRVHVLGVTVVDALQHVAKFFADAGVVLSTDSTSMEKNAIMGGVWDEEHMLRRPGASPFKHVWMPDDKGVLYHSADLAIGNIRRFTEWCAKQGGQHTAHRPAARLRSMSPSTQLGLDYKTTTTTTTAATPQRPFASR